MSRRRSAHAVIRAASDVEGLESRVLLAAVVGDDKQAPLPKVGTALISAWREFKDYRGAGKDAAKFKSKDGLLHTLGNLVAVESYTKGDPKLLEADFLKLKGTNVHRYSNGVSGYLPLDQVAAFSQLPELYFARPVWAKTNTGTVNSQGDAAQRADVARATYGYTGSGIQVGVLSDSFDTGPGSYASDQGTGNLPAGVNVLVDTPGGTDEGRAMAQLIYDSAPGASLSFATAYSSQGNFANNIKALRDNGANVIVDDVIYFAEPMFQDGVIAQAVDNVVNTGVSYFSAAGNEARQAWEGAFNSGVSRAYNAIPSSVSGLTFSGGISHDFDPGAGVDDMQRINLASGASITLSFQWSQPYGSLNVGGPASASEMDVYVLNAAGTQVVGGIASINLGFDPVEVFQFTNTGGAADFQLMLVLRSGPAPAMMKYVNFDSTTFAEWNTNSGALFGHANAAGAAGVAAAAWYNTPAFETNAPVLESFSSRGPTTIYYDAAGNLLGSPVTRQQPRFTAPDGGNTTFFFSDTTRDIDLTPNFFGTSAAAPAAAAVAALLLSYNNALTPSQVYTILQNSALDMDNPDTGGFDVGFDFATGYGLIRADAALGSLINSTISGQVFRDINTNATLDSGDSPLNGVSVFLDSNVNGTIDTPTSVVNSTDVPKTINDLTIVTSNLVVSGVPGLTTDVNVKLSITHTFDLDLDIYLISPLGIRVQLFTDVGGSGDNFTNTILDDEAATSITAGTAPFNGTFKPEGLLSFVDGINPNGTWKLEVSDDANTDTGTLTSWSLTMTTAEVSTATVGSGNYSFANLVPATYNLRQVVPAGYLQTASPSAVVTSAGVSYTGKDFADFPIVFTTAGGDDTYNLSTLGGGTTTQIIETPFAGPTVTYTIPTATLAPASLTFNTNAGDDALTIDYLNGSPIPSGGVTYNAGTHTNGDSLIVLGAAGPDTATFTATTAVLGGTTTFSGVENVSFDGRGGLDIVAVNGGAVTFPTSQHFQSLSVAAAASAALPANGSRTIYTQSLSITGTGRLDLSDNDLIYDYTGSTPIGSWNGTNYTGVTGLVQSGRNGGGWGGGGLVTTQAVALAGNRTTLAVSESSHAFGMSGPDTRLYGSETIDATCVIVKYTYGGDSNLDGKLNIDDYGRIDTNIALSLTSRKRFFANGDFNYDGLIDVDDYGIIDTNIASPGPVL